MERLLAATARAEDTHFWFLGLRRVAQQLLTAARGPRRLARIIDCGAGTGRNLEWLARYGTAVGIELEPTGVRLAHRLGRSIVQGTVVQLPFAPGTADLVTSFDVLICLDDEAERLALREMWNVLRPGGLALINVAALSILRGAHSALSQEVRRYSRRDLAARLTAAGFAVERLTYTNLSLFPAALAVRGIQRLTGRTEPSDGDLQVPGWPVNAAFNLALWLESVWLRRFNLPVGTSLIAVARKPPESAPGLR